MIDYFSDSWFGRVDDVVNTLEALSITSGMGIMNVFSSQTKIIDSVAFALSMTFVFVTGLQ